MKDDLQLALDFADLADDIAMRRFRAPDLRAEIKPTGGLVTEVDLAIETAFRSLIERERPRDAVHGEEFGLTGDSDRLWTIDPLDGTVAFEQGLRYWRTLISLVEGGEPVVGVVSRPAVPDRWWASKRRGAFVDGRPIEVSDRGPLARAVIVDDFRISVGRQLDSNAVYGLSKRCASVHPYVDDKGDFLRVASGSVDLWLLWHAGGGPDLYSQICIVREAGGMHSDLRGGLNVDAPVQLVSNGLVHQEAIACVLREIESFDLDPSAVIPEDIPAILDARRAQFPQSAFD